MFSNGPKQFTVTRLLSSVFKKCDRVVHIKISLQFQVGPSPFPHDSFKGKHIYMLIHTYWPCNECRHTDKFTCSCQNVAEI